jgi:hypothetical protein
MKYKILAAAGAALAAIGLGACSSTSSGTGTSSNAAPEAPETSAAPVATAAPYRPAPSSPAPTHKAAASGCDASLWAHVYHPYRLHVVNPCETATGTVDHVKREPDGDLHIDLAVSDAALVNSVNVADQHGDLVVEAICVGTVTQADAVDACRGIISHVTVPSAGDRVNVTGSYVLDADHGWMEIHPATSIKILASAAAAPVTPPAISPAPVQSAPVQHQSCYPLSSTGHCYEPGEFCRKADTGTYGIAGDGTRIVCTNRRWEAAG